MEYIDIVDESGLPTGETISREEAHREVILSSFGLEDVDIRKHAEEYSRLLSVARVFESKEEPDNGEEKID